MIINLNLINYFGQNLIVRRQMLIKCLNCYFRDMSQNLMENFLGCIVL